MQGTARNVAAAIVRHIPVRGRWRLIHPILGDVAEPTPVVARILHVGLMELDLSSGLEREIFVTGTHGDECLVATRALEHLREPGAVFVDVGANIGYHTVRLARHLAGMGGRAIAFEPIQANYDRLLTNLRLNHLDNVRAEKIGLSDQCETVTVHRRSRGSSNVSLASSGPIHEQVELVRFDDWAFGEGLPRVDVLKLDIEGAEVKALRGMSRAIERFRPVLLVEINPMWTKRMGTSATEVIDVLHGLGYALFGCATRRAGSGQRGRITYVDPEGDQEVNAIAIPTGPPKAG